MKAILSLLAAVLLGSQAFAAPPVWGTDLGKAISQAGQENKLGLILVGRESCGNCQATKKLINEGKVGVTADNFVVAELDSDNARVYEEFERKFKDEKFGDILPFVVITDAKGKPLASFSGLKSAEKIYALVDDAKRKAGGKK